MYGGGNIGRGFIGMLFTQSDYEVTFIDVAEPVVAELTRNHKYPLRYVSSEGFEDITVENVTAVNGNDSDAAAEAIAQADIMATAVGARILKFIVPNIVAGLRRRWADGGGVFNIIICENLNDANKILEALIKEHLTQEEIARFDASVGLVEASIGRMVPVQTDVMKDGEPLRVCVERYGFLPVDKAAFKGGIPQIKGMIPFEPFDFFVKRKLFIHNMGHATIAYLGGIKDLEYICEAVDDADIRVIAQNAMLESAIALSKRYSVKVESLLMHITDLLGRFTNAALRDTCARVGGDPARKLAKDDRMIGSSLLALEEGITPAYIAVGVAAGVKRLIDESGMQQCAESASKVLGGISFLEDGSELKAVVMKYYSMIIDGCSVTELRRAADAVKAASLKDII